MSYRLGFVMEQTLGHITHSKNLLQWISKDPEIVPTWIPISMDVTDRWSNFPVVKSNWTLLASLRAREKVDAALKSKKLDGLFFHTQVTSIFSVGLFDKIPTVVSMDATPLDFDDVGALYGHRPSSFRPLESLKNSLNRRSFRRAKGLVTWNDVARHSLISKYRVAAEKIHVIPPGIDIDKWNFGRQEVGQRPLRLLFVGGDFRRKGGETLLEAFGASLNRECELDIVTRENVDTNGISGVRVHQGLGPNSPELIALYQRADIFAFPTMADMLPLAIMEALASGLPVITTAVGALRELVEDGVNGFVIPPGDATALAEATLRLVRDRQLLRDMGQAARLSARLKFDGSTNYAKVLAVCKRCVDDA